MLGALAAAAVSVGLVFWISTAGDNSFTGPPGGEPAARPRVYAPQKPDADQVIRAFEQMQEIYANQGLSGVAAFNRSCAESVRADATLLDFCLAFDIYAAALGSGEPAAGALLSEAEVREQIMAQGAMAPGTDVAQRLAAVRALVRQTSLAAGEGAEPAAPVKPEPPPAKPEAQRKPAPAERVKPAARTAKSKVGASKSVAVKTKTKSQTKTKTAAKTKTNAATACRARSTPAQRTVCASPALRKADDRMRKAYRQALASGADQSRLARDQARWRSSLNAAAPNRAAMAKLYQKRTRQLEATTQRRRSRG